MKAQHTPGPWLCAHRKGADGMYRTEIYSAKHGGIATCDWTPKNCGNGVTSTYREANARLIAAAPDLLEIAKELEECAAYWSEYDVPLGIVYRLRAAIAKATGATEWQ